MMALAPAAVATPPVTPSAGAADAQPYTVAVLRLLIKNSKAGLLIGKGGAGIRTISDATGAKLYVHDLPPGCTERVVCPRSCNSPIASNAEALLALLVGLGCARTGSDSPLQPYPLCGVDFPAARVANVPQSS